MRILLETVAAQGISIDPDTGFREFLGRSLATIVDNIRHDAPAAGRLPRSHHRDAFDPGARPWRQAS